MSIKEIAIFGIVLAVGYWLGTNGTLNRFIPGAS